MSNYQIKNNTTGRTNTLANTFLPGSVTIPGYRQAGAAITASSLVNSAVEGVTTGYKSGNVDIGNSFCAVYNVYVNSAATSLTVANYSSCTIVMCGGGGGGGGGGRNPGRGNGGQGGSGGITIVQNIPLTGINTIQIIEVGSGGVGGQGGQAPRAQNGLPGTPGSATKLLIGATQYLANSGGGGNGAPGAGPGTPGAAGGTTPSTQNISATNLNGTVEYQTTNRTITVANISPSTRGLGGQGGSGGTNAGGAGGPGNNGYLRIYLYP